jgi:hypothetical protein
MRVATRKSNNHLKLPPNWTFRYIDRTPPFLGKGYEVLHKGIPQFIVAVDKQMPIARTIQYTWRREFDTGIGMGVS